MPDEKADKSFELLTKAIDNAAFFENLEKAPAAWDGDNYAWQWQRKDGITEPSITRMVLMVRPDMFGAGFEIALILNGWRGQNRQAFFSIVYWGEWIKKENLEDEDEILMKLRLKFSEGWNLLPELSAKSME